MSFATTLQSLRKEAGLTQEQLASKFGVSAQAVSKWENGSFPEGDLIPKIADLFHVSIDYLYGREERNAGAEEQLVRELTAIWKKEGSHEEHQKDYMEKLFRLMWAFQISAWSDNMHYYDRPQVDKDSDLASALVFHGGFSYMRLNRNKQFYVALKEPDEKEGFLKWFDTIGTLQPMLQLLADPGSAKALLYLYTLDSSAMIGAEAISKATGVPKEKVEAMLETMCNKLGKHEPAVYCVRVMKENGKSELVYGIEKTRSGLLLGVLALLDSYVNSQGSYSIQINNRQKAWIEKMP